MGLFGGRRNLSASQQVARGGDGMDPSTMRPAFFDQGGTGRAMAGYMGDALLNLSGGKPVYAPMMQEHQKQQDELQRMMQLAQYKAQNPQPTDIMREAQSMNLQPGTPEYNDFVRTWRMKQPMIVLGNPENGQQVINPMGGASSGSPAPPQPGEVVDGHTFLGGDPASPASWRQQ